MYDTAFLKRYIGNNTEVVIVSYLIFFNGALNTFLLTVILVLEVFL